MPEMTLSSMKMLFHVIYNIYVGDSDLARVRVEEEHG